MLSREKYLYDTLRKKGYSKIDSKRMSKDVVKFEKAHETKTNWIEKLERSKVERL